MCNFIMLYDLIMLKEIERKVSGILFNEATGFFM